VAFTCCDMLTACDLAGDLRRAVVPGGRPVHRPLRLPVPVRPLPHPVRGRPAHQGPMVRGRAGAPGRGPHGRGRRGPRPGSGWPAGSRRSPSGSWSGAWRTAASPTAMARATSGPHGPWRRWSSPISPSTIWPPRARPRPAWPSWPAATAAARWRRWRRRRRPTWPGPAGGPTRPGASWSGRSTCSRGSTSRTRRPWCAWSWPAPCRTAAPRWPWPRPGRPATASSGWGPAATPTPATRCSAPSARREGPGPSGSAS
jgi:hypothetical protein